jgi:hypothetical protein
MTRDVEYLVLSGKCSEVSSSELLLTLNPELSTAPMLADQRSRLVNFSRISSKTRSISDTARGR